MKRSKFFFKQSYLEAASLFTDPVQRAEFLMAVTQYGIDGTTYQGDNETIRIAMALIMPQIDSENRRYTVDGDPLSRVATCRDRQESINDIQPQCRVATCRDREKSINDIQSQSRVATCRDRENNDCKDKTEGNNAPPATVHRDLRRWIKINAPNVYQRLCRKISNRNLESLLSRYDRQQLQRKILLLEHNGKVRDHLDELSIAIKAIEETLAA